MFLPYRAIRSDPPNAAPSSPSACLPVKVMTPAVRGRGVSYLATAAVAGSNHSAGQKDVQGGHAGRTIKKVCLPSSGEVVTSEEQGFSLLSRLIQEILIQ